VGDVSASQGNWFPQFQTNIIPSYSRVLGTFIPVKKTALFSFETSETNYPVTQRHIPEEQSPRLHGCEDPVTRCPGHINTVFRRNAVFFVLNQVLHAVTAVNKAFTLSACCSY
jgi:hypothetical protein